MIFTYLIIGCLMVLLSWYYVGRINKVTTLVSDSYIRSKIRYQDGLRKHTGFQLPTINHWGHLLVIAGWLLLLTSYDVVDETTLTAWAILVFFITIGNIAENALKWFIITDIRHGVNDPWKNGLTVVDSMLSVFLPVFFVQGLSLVQGKGLSVGELSQLTATLIVIGLLAYIIITSIANVKYRENGTFKS